MGSQADLEPAKASRLQWITGQIMELKTCPYLYLAIRNATLYT